MLNSKFSEGNEMYPTFQIFDFLVKVILQSVAASAAAFRLTHPDDI